MINKSIVKPILVCDVDDVLSKFNEQWIKVYNEKSGDNLTADQITDWDMTKFVLPEWKDKIFTKEIIYSPRLYYNVELKEYAKEFVEWADNTFELLLVTAATISADMMFTNFDKAEWIEEHFPNYDIRKFIPCYWKQFLKADIRIDDRPKNLCGEANIKILMDRPWNYVGCNEQKYIDLNNPIRKFNLLEVKEFLNNIF